MKELKFSERAFRSIPVGSLAILTTYAPTEMLTMSPATTSIRKIVKSALPITDSTFLKPLSFFG